MSPLANLTASLLDSNPPHYTHHVPLATRYSLLSALPLLLIVYAILHISYGLGFLAGLLRFAYRWGDKQGKTPSLRSPGA